jgi:hypothetical protein
MKKRLMDAVQRKEVVLFAVLAAFLLSYYLISFQRTDEYSVDGLKIYSAGQPRDALAGFFSGPAFAIEEQLRGAAGDEGNAAVQAVAAEFSYALASHGKKVSVYGTIAGAPVINCNENTSNCTGANIVIGIGECDCVRVGQKIEVYGSPAFLRDNAVKIRGIIKMVLAQVAPTAFATIAPTPRPEPLQCANDSQCVAGGPYGILCGTPEAVNVTGLDWEPEFKCFDPAENLTTCGCNGGRCKWDRTPEFCACGLEYNFTFGGC